MSDKPVTYELTIKEFEAIVGTTKRFVRKGKKLKVGIPSGVNSGTIVVLPNALKITDGKAGDILILIKVFPIETLNPQPWLPHFCYMIYTIFSSALIMYNQSQNVNTESPQPVYG